MDRIMVTLPPDLVEAVDIAARAIRKKRSQVVRQALQEWLERQRREQFEALLAEGYQEMARAVECVAAESLPLQAAATEGIWVWDE